MKSRFLEKAFAWSADDGSMEDTLEFLLDVGRQIGRRAVLITTDDLGTILLDENANLLKERFLFPEQPQGLARSLSNKKEMYYLCKRMDVPTPEAAFPTSQEDVVNYVRGAAFPIVMKGIDAWSHYGTLRETGMDRVLILESASELLESYSKLEAAGSPDVLLQEYIPGGPDSVWMFNGYFDEGSDCLLGYTGQKIRQHPPYTGFATLGSCVDNEVVESVTKRLMKEIGYRGPLDIGYRFDARDNKYKLLDVNPRMGGTFRLFVGENGMDVAIAYARDGRLGFASWIRSLRDVQEGAWFATDDLAPARSVLFSSMGKVFVLLSKGPLLRWLSASQRWISSRGRI
jgi:predicted ATP-grasp superfamily ATP-dependent carboligase